MLEIEACIECDDDELLRRSVANACSGGAARVELCRELGVSGLTPAARHIALAREAFGSTPGVLALIRPRAGDFAYTSGELKTMIGDIEAAKLAGADGIVLGAVRDGRLDTAVLDPLLSLAKRLALDVTFHRAFDDLERPLDALDALVDRGVRRILTSGTPLSASASILDGVHRLEALIRYAGSRIEIVLGGGVSFENIEHVLHVLGTDVRAATAISVHSHSALLQDGITSATRVRELKTRCRASFA